MILKRLPEDFRVEELTAQKPARTGPYVFYRLEKKGIGTLEAVEAVARRWNLPTKAVSYGGLKDRHAVTVQYLTIRGGPPRSFSDAAVRLECLGRAERPFTPADIAGNRFTIVVRSVHRDDVPGLAKACETVGRNGFPNYFDDQRFGSVGTSGEFIARAWCRGDFSRALWLAIAEPNARDRADEKAEKEILRALWGDWKGAKEALRRSHRRSLVSYLADHPQDFKGAFARLRVDLRGLYLAAYQSHLWNRILAECLRRLLPPDDARDVPLKTGSGVFFTRLPEGIPETLPLPSARLRLPEGALKSLVDAVLSAEGTALREIRVKYPRDSFFSKGDRRTVARPGGLAARDAADDLYPGKRKIALSFDLPRGAYATMLVRRLGLSLREGMPAGQAMEENDA